LQSALSHAAKETDSYLFGLAALPASATDVADEHDHLRIALALCAECARVSVISERQQRESRFSR
jgi:ferredoxin-like protein FixX